MSSRRIATVFTRGEVAVKGPLANLEASIAQMRAETNEGLVTGSRIFAQHGDPRNWTEFDGTTPITFHSESDRERSIASYDEWITGAWNEIPGVIKPTSFGGSLPMVS